jgi:hypothetical protein
MVARDSPGTGAIAFIGCLSGPVGVGPGKALAALRGCYRGSSEHILNRPLPVARQMVLQVAVRDIGQLTDFDRSWRPSPSPSPNPPPPARGCASRPVRPRTAAGPSTTTPTRLPHPPPTAVQCTWPEGFPPVGPCADREVRASDDKCAHGPAPRPSRGSPNPQCPSPSAGCGSCRRRSQGRASSSENSGLVW